MRAPEVRAFLMADLHVAGAPATGLKKSIENITRDASFSYGVTLGASGRSKAHEES
jgi:hypothetical protein